MGHGGVPPYIFATNEGFSVETGKLPPPQVSYDADCAWIDRRGGAASLVFGKLDRKRLALRSRLEIRIPVEQFVQFWRNSEAFHQRLKSVIASSPALQETALDVDVKDMEAAKDHSDWATIVVITQTGGQAQIDCYSLPHGDVYMYTKSGDRARLEVRPVVRVFTTPAVIDGMMDQAEAVAKELNVLGVTPPELES